ncbi:hypothetical protein [Streptomyces sp. NBC_01212]|uniref:hypothetical protein n=1 Tax=Streptomyces sp. NBC_01212 TaxID=2903775 RepID=UPI003FA37F3C
MSGLPFETLWTMPQRDLEHSMKMPVSALRWQLAGTLVSTVLLVSAPTASAVTASTREAPGQAQTARDSGIATEALSSYRGVQGGNLCLLARCAVGGSGASGGTGPSNTQGFNLCLLALCNVRP